MEQLIIQNINENVLRIILECCLKNTNKRKNFLYFFLFVQYANQNLALINQDTA